MGWSNPLGRAQQVFTLISYEGWATADGAAGGTTIVDTRLIGVNDYVTNKAVLIMSGPCIHELKRVLSFASATGIITTQAFSAQITTGTQYRILNLMPDGGITMASGLFYQGVITTWTNATQFAALGLAGFGNQAFANGQYFIFAFRDGGGAADLPQSEVRLLQTYVSATGTFTHEAFDVALAVGDTVMIIHQSLLFPGAVPGYGAFDTSSATVPADSGRAARFPTEVADHFKGMLLMPVSGACRFITRRIVGFTLVGGIFTIDPNNPFPAATGNEEYLIINDQTEFVPAANGANNRTPSDVVGNKTDTAITAKDDVSSLMRYLKGLMDYSGDIETKIDGALVVTELFATTVTLRNNQVTLFQLDALGGTMRNINLNFYLALDAAATFTVTIQKTRVGDLITFTQDEELDDTIVLPAANRVHSYALGDLPEGLQMRVIIAQDNAGNATNAVDAALTYEG